MNEHEHGADDEMQASQGLRQSLIAEGESPEAVTPDGCRTLTAR
jgi:hypothetical protein